MKLMSLALILFSIPASAAYDGTWYQADFWSGEYPNGIAIVAEGVAIPARSSMDKDRPVTIECELPYKAVYHPWNQARPAKYRTAAKIIPMTANEAVTLGEAGDQAQVAAGELVEYLIYGSEGSFLVRYNGKEYVADQSLLEKMTYDEERMETPQEEWLNVTCVGGEDAWIFMNELVQSDRDGNPAWPEGTDSWYRGLREYGVVTDLTDADLGGNKP